MALLQIFMEMTDDNFFGGPEMMVSYLVQEWIYLRKNEGTLGVAHGIA